MANKSEHPKCIHPKCNCGIICNCYYGKPPIPIEEDAIRKIAESK
jgi:hypothetical protein